MGELLTIGHGTLDRAGLTEQLQGAGAELLVDVRRFPGSRRNPDVSRDALPAWLPEEGIEYRWEPDLGGRRRLADEPALDTWWQVEAFRAYAAYTRTVEFRAAFHGLVTLSARRRTVILCSESVWWRCHRRIIADVAVLGAGLEVLHIMPAGRRSAHRPSAGARLGDDGLLVWDVTGTPDEDSSESDPGPRGR